MKKVIITGCTGAGKSTFARKLAEVTALPLYHLDNIWHLPDRSMVSREGFDLRIEEVMARDEWIIDGNYLRTLPWRLDNCDIVFFFDLLQNIWIAGIKERVGKERDDMPWIEQSRMKICTESLKTFPKDRLP